MSDGDYERRDGQARNLAHITRRLRALRASRFLKGAIFDQDGLLFDTEVLFQQSWKEAGRRMGVDVPDAYVHAVCGCGRERLPDIIRRHFTVSDIEAYISLALEICTEKQLRSVPEKPGLHELLSFFRARGVKMAVASSSTRFLVEHNLRAAGIADCFDAIVTGGDVTAGKPAPDIFLLAAARLDLPPSDCWVFEDSPAGIRAARAAGCAPVMVPDRTPPTDEIRSFCTDICPSLLAVRDRLATY